MQPADTVTAVVPDDATPVGSMAHVAGRTSGGAMSVALFTAVACMPIVVAVGFLTDRPQAAPVPGDISVLALRGVLDGAAADRTALAARAGY